MVFTHQHYLGQLQATVMVEPTESESLYELERFGAAMVSIRREIDKNKDILKNSPHTAKVVSATKWEYNYSREEAAYPVNQTNKWHVHGQNFTGASDITNRQCLRLKEIVILFVLVKITLIMKMELKDWLNSINQTKKNLIDEDPSIEKEYPPYIINRCFSGHLDAVMFANEMNKYNFLPKKMQYDFYINTLRTKKRFSPAFVRI